MLAGPTFVTSFGDGRTNGGEGVGEGQGRLKQEQFDAEGSVK